MGFITKQVDLIFKKFELRFLVWCLCFINLATVLYWKYSAQTLESLSNVCWPIFVSCDNFITPYLLYAMIATCVLTLICLLLQLRSFAFLLLTLTFLLKLGLYLLNYSFSDNFLVLVFFIEFALFFFPLKSLNIKVIILMFILWSGLSKLNLNWLSGLEIKNYMPELPIKGIEWVSAFVVILQLVCPFILVSKLKIIFHYAWVGLVIYYLGHAFLTKNIFYLIPVALMAYIVIFQNTEEKNNRGKLYKNYHLPEPSRLWVILPVAIFCLINWTPTNQHPFKALSSNPIQLKKRHIPLECLIKTIVSSAQKYKFLEQEHINSNGNDFKCYPDKHKDFDSVCTQYKNYENAIIHKSFYSKELTAEKFTKIFHTSYNCSTKGYAL